MVAETHKVMPTAKPTWLRRLIGQRNKSVLCASPPAKQFSEIGLIGATVYSLPNTTGNTHGDCRVFVVGELGEKAKVMTGQIGFRKRTTVDERTDEIRPGQPAKGAKTRCTYITRNTLCASMRL